jgi:ribose 5-phosphate isomerase B
MQQITIGIGADHRGFELKQLLRLRPMIGDYEIIWHDVGCFSVERTDYPPFAQQVARMVKNGEVDLGVLFCGTGTGMAIAANRFPGIYAGVAWDPVIARRMREDDKVNILVVPADFIVTEAPLIDLVEAWLSATFKGGRYAERLTML